MTVSELELREPQQTQTGTNKLITPLILIGFSIFYFTNVLIRASEKYFWFDELVTMYISRLPNLHGVEQVLAHKIDFNPLLFYVVTRASRAVFGENLIGLRVPQIIGFWILSLCLFRFVSRRAGWLAGLIAMVLPTTTGAFFYAYEARAHGIVLGFCGLALVCWQMAMEEPRKKQWLIWFSVSLLGAAMMHCYGLLIVIPFSIVEILQTLRSRRVNWQIWAALVAPSIIAVAVYIPLLRSYSSMLGGTSFTSIFPASVAQITSFYNFLLYPCIVLIVCALAVIAAGKWIGSRSDAREVQRSAPTVQEIVLAISFLALPVFGLLVAILVHSPFMARYFISAVAGVCILIGLGVGGRGRTRWPAIVLAAVMACSVGWQFSALLWHRYHGKGEPLFEPSTGLFLETTPGNPVTSHQIAIYGYAEVAADCSPTRPRVCLLDSLRAQPAFAPLLREPGQRRFRY